MAPRSGGYIEHCWGRGQEESLLLKPVFVSVDPCLSGFHAAGEFLQSIDDPVEISSF